MNNTDARREYSDIIDLPHHQSESRPHMTMNDRAAQFAPFAALSGFEEMVDEETRFTEAGISLEENALELMERQIALMVRDLDEGKAVYASFTCFIPDSLKEGGRYIQLDGQVKKIDFYSGMIILFGNDDGPDKLRKSIDIDIGSITSIEFREII